MRWPSGSAIRRRDTRSNIAGLVTSWSIAPVRSTRQTQTTRISSCSWGLTLDGIPLEVIGLELASEDLFVIHAMKLRQKYRADYERVMRCQGQ